METVRTLEVAPAPAADESPLAHARLHRQLTVDEAARRAGVERIVFASSNHAVGSICLLLPSVRV